MTKVAITEQYLTNIANAIRGKNGSSDTYTPAEMATAIANIPSGGGSDSLIVTLSWDDDYFGQGEGAWFPDCAWADMAAAQQNETPIVVKINDRYGASAISDGCWEDEDFFVIAVVDWRYEPVTNYGYCWTPNGYELVSDAAIIYPNFESPSRTYTPSTTAQTDTITYDTSQDYNGIEEVTVTVNAMPSGTAGTPTATKGTVSNHAVSVTPSVTNTTGYITGSTKTGTAVTVSASELVSGSETKTANGTYDVANLAELIVNVSSGGLSKNTQVVQGTTRTSSSALTAIGAEMTVSKTGTYDVYWSAFRSTTSSSYTYGTQLYVDGSAYGTQNTTWSSHVQNNHLSNVSLTANQKIRVYGRNSRGSSYYIYAPTLVIVEA